MSWTRDEVIAATGAAAEPSRSPSESYAAVCTDTRRLTAGSLFVALRGEHHDGHRFLGEALAAGASGLLVERVPAEVDAAHALVVSDTTRALGDLAAWTRRRWGGSAAAITGSNGKTTTKEMLAAICEQVAPGSVLKTHGNLNNLIGLPLTLLGLAGDEALAVLEMGMNAPGEIARMTEIAAPNVGVITNVGAAHLQGLGTIAGVAAAKGELFAGMAAGTAIAVNMDDEWVTKLAAGFTGRRIEFGDGREVTATETRDFGWDGVGFTLHVAGRTAPVRLAMAGRHNVNNALAAAAVAHGLGIGLEAIALGLRSVTPPPMRTEVVRLANGVTLLNDAYNANPDSMMAALHAIAKMPGRAIAVLGEMRELGPTSARLHRELGKQASARGISVIVAVGPQAEEIALGARAAAGAGAEIHVCPDAAAAAELVQELWRTGDAILVKGSRGADTEPGVQRYGARMVEVVRRLEEAGGL